jgi:hypothetical protein
MFQVKPLITAHMPKHKLRELQSERCKNLQRHENVA